MDAVKNGRHQGKQDKFQLPELYHQQPGSLQPLFLQRNRDTKNLMEAGVLPKKKLYGVNTKRVDLQLLSISTFSLGFETGTFQTVVQFNWGNFAPGGSGVIEDAKLLDVTLPVDKKRFELQYTKNSWAPQQPGTDMPLLFERRKSNWYKWLM